jgi:hypothetical protein
MIGGTCSPFVENRNLTNTETFRIVTLPSPQSLPLAGERVTEATVVAEVG